MKTRQQKAAALIGLFTLSGFFTAPAALALPPGGASSNTPGTSSTVSPTTVKACEKLSWTVSGFPAGETAHVKIDDGQSDGSNTAVQGTGVVSKGVVDSSGTARGSFTVPCTLGAGSHTLRFLASHEVDGKGVEGYSNKSPAFTVVAAASNTASTGNQTNTQNNASDKSGGAENPASDAGTSNAASGSNTVVRRVTRGSGGSGNTSNSNQTGTNDLSGPLALGAQATSEPTSIDTVGTANTTNLGTGAGEVKEITLASNSKAPIVGYCVAGAILIVGLAGIAAYLYTHRRTA